MEKSIRKKVDAADEGIDPSKIYRSLIAILKAPEYSLIERPGLYNELQSKSFHDLLSCIRDKEIKMLPSDFSYPLHAILFLESPQLETVQLHLARVPLLP